MASTPRDARTTAFNGIASYRASLGALMVARNFRSFFMAWNCYWIAALGVAVTAVGCCHPDRVSNDQAMDRVVPSRATTQSALPASKPSSSTATSLFDGKALGQWTPIDYAGMGEVHVEGGSLILPVGERLTGVRWAGEFPKNNYEIELNAQRVDGSDFFVGLTFPDGDTFGSLILGGWGGAVCGISSLDDEDAAHNPTRTFQNFENGKWYHVRLRVSGPKVEAWVDRMKIVDLDITGKKMGLRVDVDESKPMGLASFQCTSAIKNIRWTKIAG
jgi:hypothetical protein